MFNNDPALIHSIGPIDKFCTYMKYLDNPLQRFSSWLNLLRILFRTDGTLSLLSYIRSSANLSSSGRERNYSSGLLARIRSRIKSWSSGFKSWSIGKVRSS